MWKKKGSIKKQKKCTVIIRQASLVKKKNVPDATPHFISTLLLTQLQFWSKRLFSLFLDFLKNHKGHQILLLFVQGPFYGNA